MRLLTGLALAGFTIMAAQAARACTATSTVDKARQTKDTDQYRAARDVAEAFIDTEKYVTNDATIESGTGSLLLERDNCRALSLDADLYRKTNLPGGHDPGFTEIPNDGRTPADWVSILDKSSTIGHGLTKDLQSVGYFRPATVADHMRQHVYEWHRAFTGNDPALLEMWKREWTPAEAPQVPASPFDHAG